MTYPHLDFTDLRRAIHFWKTGLGTFEIAERLNVEEAAVANSLAQWRESERMPS